MFLFGKKKKNRMEFVAPVAGKSVNLSDLKDEMFSSRALGLGIAIVPESDDIVSPCDGNIKMIAETKHAIAIENEDGVQVLIHVGFDTVNLEGKGFKTLCSNGGKVSRGEPILKINRRFLEDEGMDYTVMMVIVEPNKHEIEECEAGQSVEAGNSTVIKYK